VKERVRRSLGTHPEAVYIEKRAIEDNNSLDSEERARAWMTKQTRKLQSTNNRVLRILKLKSLGSGPVKRERLKIKKC